MARPLRLEYERQAARPSLPELFADVRDRETRNRQIHVAIRTHQYRLQAVADFLGLSPSTISMIAARLAKAGV